MGIEPPSPSSGLVRLEIDLKFHHAPGAQLFLKNASRRAYQALTMRQRREVQERPGLVVNIEESSVWQEAGAAPGAMRKCVFRAKRRPRPRKLRAIYDLSGGCLRQTLTANTSII